MTTKTTITEKQIAYINDLKLRYPKAAALINKWLPNPQTKEEASWVIDALKSEEGRGILGTSFGSKHFDELSADIALLHGSLWREAHVTDDDLVAGANNLPTSITKTGVPWLGEEDEVIVFTPEEMEFRRVDHIAFGQEQRVAAIAALEAAGLM